jgi:hypothetical protein
MSPFWTPYKKNPEDHKVQNCPDKMTCVWKAIIWRRDRVEAVRSLKSNEAPSICRPTTPRGTFRIADACLKSSNQVKIFWAIIWSAQSKMIWYPGRRIVV